jgi:hypothetical protein
MVGRSIGKGPKMFALNYRDRPWPNFPWLTLELDATVVSGNLLDASGTLFGAFSISPGVELRGASSYVRLSNGYTVLTHTNHKLGTYYQWCTTFSAGWTEGPRKLGIFFRHYSNGSLQKTNKGYDFIGIEFSQQF